MIEDYTPLNGFRYERKFVCNNTNRGQVDVLIRRNPAVFKQSYKPRQVNNIYFDTPGLDCYFDNLFGIGKRWKARIRWYGELHQKIERPVLELKIKHGHLGTKESWILNSFCFSTDSNNSLVLKKALSTSELPEDVRNKLLGMQPVLVNNYQRAYFVSANKNFRLTVDSKLEYRDFHFFKKITNLVNKESDKIVVELKYSKEHDENAGTITNSFPFRLNKNSKFVSGMSFIRPGIAD